MSNLEPYLAELRRLYTLIDDEPEPIEPKVAQVNAVVNELKQIGFLSRCPEFADTSPPQNGESSTFSQATLLIPQGFGICNWDSNSYRICRDSPEGLGPHAARVFNPFAKCTPAEQSIVLPFVVKVLEDFIDLIIIEPHRHDRTGAIPAKEFFAARHSKREVEA